MSLQLSSLFLLVAFLLLPGLVWMKVQKAFGKKTDATQFDLVLNAFIYSLISYLVLFVIFLPMHLKMHLLEIKTDEKELIVANVIPEILEALGIALVLSLVWLYVSRYKLVTRLLQFLNATSTYGDEDVWDYSLNSSSLLSQFVHLRDFEQRVVYAGDVKVFSETGKMRELVLEGVAVYDFEGNELYQIPALYLSRSPENIHIEFPGSALLDGSNAIETPTSREHLWPGLSSLPQGSKLALSATLLAMALYVGRRSMRAMFARAE